MAESITELALIQFQHLYLGTVLVPWSLLFSEFLCLISHSLAVWHFWKPCSSSWTQHWLSIERTDVEAETPILWPPDVKSWLIWKDHDAGKDWGQEKGTTEDEIVGWHHRHNRHGFEWTMGVGDRQGGLACCGSWGCQESHMTERLNWTENMN